MLGSKFAEESIGGSQKKSLINHSEAVLQNGREVYRKLLSPCGYYLLVLKVSSLEKECDVEQRGVRKS